MRQSPTFTPSGSLSPRTVLETPQSLIEGKLQQLLIDEGNLSTQEIIATLYLYRTTLSQQGIDETETQLAIDRVLNEYFPTKVAQQIAVMKTPSSAASPVLTTDQTLPLRQTIQMNQPNVVRPPPGPIGYRVPASITDIDVKVGQTNGFIAANVATVLGSLVTRNFRQPELTRIIQEELIRRRGQALTEEDLKQFRRDLLGVGGRDPARIHAFFMALLNSVGGVEAFREILWRSLGDVTLRQLLGGFGINKPMNNNQRKDWVHDPNQQRTDRAYTAEQFSRYAYDKLFDRYVAEGAYGDQLAPDAERRRQPRQFY